jgi:transcriptional regulator with XRE-family HTH domain
MEFKDKLKKLRQEKKISQQALADAIFVSRSAVAKWENGLGIPGKDSYMALLDYFKINEVDLPLNEEAESANIPKNKKMRVLSTAICCLALCTMALFTLLLLHALMNGYGFTADMAAGDVWRDEEKIVTPEYVIYYYSLPMNCDDPTVDTSKFLTIDGLSVVKKQAVGYLELKSIEDYRRDVYLNGEHVGIIYSFKGKNSYYHVYRNDIVLQPEGGFNLRIFDSIRIKEDTYSVFRSSYFETPFELTEFYIGKELFIVK